MSCYYSDIKGKSRSNKYDSHDTNRPGPPREAHRDRREDVNEPLPHASKSAEMQCRHAALTCRAAGRARTLRPQARQPRSRYQPHVVTDEMRSTRHSHTQCALSTCRAHTRYSPAGPWDEPGTPGPAVLWSRFTSTLLAFLIMSHTSPLHWCIVRTARMAESVRVVQLDG